MDKSELLFTLGVPRGVLCEQRSHKTRELQARNRIYAISVHFAERAAVNGVNSNKSDIFVDE